MLYRLLENRISSILKWAGGKRRIAHFLSRFSPEVIDLYFEPFLGSGALFLYLAQTKPRFKAILSDSNNDLINVYKCVRDNVRNLIDILEIHQSSYYKRPEEYYYYVRDTFSPANDLENAASLIFLNKTCYIKDYTKDEFGYPEQVMLAKEFRRLSNMRSTVLLSNSNSEFITDLYKDFNIMTISTSRPINCNASNRLRHQELLITNKRLLVTKAVTND